MRRAEANSLQIALASSYYRPHVGGIERFTELLARGLAAKGHAVTVVCCRTEAGTPLDEMIDGYVVRRIPATNVIERRVRVPYPLPSPGALRARLGEALDGSDVLHVQDAIYGLSVAALHGARRRELPSVLTQHVAFVPQRSRLLNLVERVAIATLGRSARTATRVATYNPSVREWAQDTWGLEDVRVLPVGAAAAPPLADRDSTRRAFELPEDRFLALFVGRDVAKKRLDLFLGATDPAYELVAVTDRESVDGARLLPLMEHGRLQQLLGSVDAFVLPSEGEGFPLVLQEALVAGIPIVTSPHPGYEQYLAPGDVLLVDRSSDAIREGLRRLAGDQQLQRELSIRARDVAERYLGLDRFVAAYESLYAEAHEAVRRS